MSTPLPRRPFRPTESLAAGAAWLPTGVSGLQLVDLRAAYLNWWPVVDFALLLALFAGIVHATVGRRFEAKGGQLVTMALGGALALGGLGFEWAFGFNLSSLAPLAAALFLMVVAVSTFWLFRSAGLGKAAAVVCTVVLLAVAVSAISPQFTGPLSWVTGLLQLGGFLGISYLVVSTLFGRGKPAGSGAVAADAKAIDGRQTDRDVSTQRWSDQEHVAFADEKRSVARSLRPITKQAEKTSERVLSELRLVKKVLAGGQPQEKDRHLIAGALARIPPERLEVARLLDQVKRADQRLMSFDEKTLPSLTARASPMGPKERSALYRMVLEEREKIGIEKKIEYVEGFVEKYGAQAGSCIQQAADQLVRGDLTTATRWLDAAIAYEEQAMKMIERTRAVERMLQRLTRLQLRQLRDAA